MAPCIQQVLTPCADAHEGEQISVLPRIVLWWKLLNVHSDAYQQISTAVPLSKVLQKVQQIVNMNRIPRFQVFLAMEMTNSSSSCA